MGKALLVGWQLGGILSLPSGLPGTVEIGSRLMGIGIRLEYLDLAPGASNNPTRPGNPNEYFDKSAFVFPQGEGRTTDTALGNLGRNTLSMPGLATVDFSLTKNTHVSEAARLQFRFEALNLFNRPNFKFRNRIVFDRRGQLDPTAGWITSTDTSARQAQFGLKLIF